MPESMLFTLCDRHAHCHHKTPWWAYTHQRLSGSLSLIPHPLPLSSPPPPFLLSPHAGGGRIEGETDIKGSLGGKVEGQGPGVHPNHVVRVGQWLPVFIRIKPHWAPSWGANPGQERDLPSICCFIVSRARVMLWFNFGSITFFVAKIGVSLSHFVNNNLLFMTCLAK